MAPDPEYELNIGTEYGARVGSAFAATALMDTNPWGGPTDEEAKASERAAMEARECYCPGCESGRHELLAQTPPNYRHALEDIGRILESARSVEGCEPTYAEKVVAAIVKSVLG